MARLTSTDNIEKLLEIAKVKPKEKPVKQANPEVLKYIEECKLEPGRKKIPGYVIYYHYSEWKKGKLLSKITFFKTFNMKFQKVKVGSGTSFLVSPKPFDLTPIGYFKARAFLRKQRYEKQKEKSKK